MPGMRSLFMLATIAVLGVPWPLIASPETHPATVKDRVDLLLFEGELLLEEGKVSEAIASFTEVVSLEPERLDGHLLLARALTSALLSGEAEKPRALATEALTQYRWVLRHEPGHPEAAEGERLLTTRFLAPEEDLVSEEARAAWTRGQEAMAASEYEDAAKAFEEAARLDPKSWSIHRAWGEALEKSGEPRKALAAYEKAAEIDTDDPDLHVDLGRVLESLNRVDDAIRHYGEALDARENHAPATQALLRLLADRQKLSPAMRGLLGRAHLASGDAEKAIAILEPLVQDDPDRGLQKALATAYFLGGNDDRAEAIFTELQEGSPHDTEILYYLGAIRLRRGDLENGRRLLRSVLAINPEDASTLRLLGVSLSDEPGQEKEAINTLLRAEASGASIDGLSCILGTLYLRIDLPQRAHPEFLQCLQEKPEFTGAHLGLGLIADDLGRKGEAIGHLERYLALEADPEPAAIFRLGVAYLRSGKDTEGFSTLRRLVVSRTDSIPAPGDVDLLEMTSFFLATVRRFEDAVFIGEMLLTRNPQNPIYNNNLAMTYADAKIKLERALQLAEKANRLDPENAGHLDTLGWALLRMQRFAEAESTLAASVRLAERAEADNPSEIYYHLGVLYRLTGRNAEAARALTRASENPPSPFLREEIQKLLDEVTREENR